MNRFAHTYCSQCGADLGPGDAGVSRCSDHARRLSEEQVYAAFQEAFPGHDLHQESIDFARGVEQRLLGNLEPLLADALEVAQLAWHHPEEENTQGLAFNLRNKLRDYFGVNK